MTNTNVPLCLPLAKALSTDEWRVGPRLLANLSPRPVEEDDETDVDDPIRSRGNVKLIAKWIGTRTTPAVKQRRGAQMRKPSEAFRLTNNQSSVMIDGASSCAPQNQTSTLQRERQQSSRS
eukprot:TRINITY_DN14759_c0_g1_i1.p2 TRINITY_DN14759_c0_g1~~TRINITY_DN14759_c0_g1_i1.p2  ORF type:complete len:121 (-),score=2.87 TRINITY_DN14759_c0_g1_i1:84-446(-)